MIEPPLEGKNEIPPSHPYWCDNCGGRAGFTIPGCDIDHTRDCERFGEDSMTVYRAAVEYCRRTGKTIQ